MQRLFERPDWLASTPTQQQGGCYRPEQQKARGFGGGGGVIEGRNNVSATIISLGRKLELVGCITGEIRKGDREVIGNVRCHGWIQGSGDRCQNPAWLAVGKRTGNKTVRARRTTGGARNLNGRRRAVRGGQTRHDQFIGKDRGSPCAERRDLIHIGCASGIER